jgi:hypothetical protein
MIRRGQTADVAIDNVYRAYGWNHSVTQILNRMKRVNSGNGFLGDEPFFYHEVGRDLWGGYYYAGRRHNN